jgi:hypothetical protein
MHLIADQRKARADHAVFLRGEALKEFAFEAMSTGSKRMPASGSSASANGIRCSTIRVRRPWLNEGSEMPTKRRLQMQTSQTRNAALFTQEHLLPAFRIPCRGSQCSARDVAFNLKTMIAFVAAAAGERDSA